MVPNRDAVSRACPNDRVGVAARRTNRQKRTTGLRVINPNLLELSFNCPIGLRGILIVLRSLSSSYSPVRRAESSFKCQRVNGDGRAGRRTDQAERSFFRASCRSIFM